MALHRHCDNCTKDLTHEKTRSTVHTLNERLSMHLAFQVYRSQASPCWQDADLCRTCEDQLLVHYVGED